MPRENTLEPYCDSSSLDCAESDISVSVTCMALREVHSVSTMIAPAVSMKIMLAGMFSFRADITTSVFPASRAIE